MRITVWNINGLRTLKGYQPWYKLPDWEACLEHLGADIACFQETKMTRKQLTESMCILPSYYSFFNFHPVKGYSGTVTYVRKSASIPLKAEQGITGRLVTDPEEAIGCNPVDTRDDVEPAIWNGIDDEGRAVVLDLGLFVLFNVYAPNETGPERLEYKMSYYNCLAERAHRLISAGREVMIVGDMNIIRDPIDHCDPDQSIKEHGWTHFHQHPARAWFANFLAPKGKFHDVGRIYHPNRRKMFTCWNTLIDARPANYGVRLDYTLVTEGLLKWVKGADIQPDVYGSDHCPVYIDLHDEIEVDGKVIKLKDVMHGGERRPPPSLAACHYAEFSSKQRKLASFFSASKRSLSESNGVASGASPSQSPTPGKNMTSADTTLSAIQDETSIGENGEESASLAEALFALHSQQEGIGLDSPSNPPAAFGSVSAPSESKLLDRSTSEQSTATNPDSKAVGPAVAASSRNISPARAASPTKCPTSTPKDAIQGKKQGKTSFSKGQTSLQSFFAKPAASTTSNNGKTTSSAPDTSMPTKTKEAGLSTATTQAVAAGTPPSGTTNEWSTQDQEDCDDDAIESYADEAVQCTSQHSASNTSSTENSSAVERVESSLAWGAIFSPIPAPLCRLHNEVCRAWTVNKPGPNHGRKFWLCARPVGPGYEKSGRAKGDVNPEYRCNFFLWDSDLRSESARKKRKEAEASPIKKKDQKEPKFFAELGRERKKSQENTPHGGRHPDGPHKKVRGNEK